MYNLKKHIIMVAMAAAALPAFSQAADAPNIRLLNAVPQSGAISVKMGDTVLFTDVNPNDITPYKAIPKQDDRSVVVSMPDGRTVKTTDKMDVDNDDKNYLLLVTPDDSGANPKVVILKSDRDDVDQDEVQLTLVNAAPQHKSIKVKLNDDTEERGVNYADAKTGDVKPGVYTLSVIDASGNDTVIASKSVTLTGGTAVSVIVTGSNMVKVVNDNSPATDMTAQSGQATIHNRTTTGTSMGAPAPNGPMQTQDKGAATQAPATMTTPSL